MTLRENLIDGISGYDIKKDKRKVVENFKTLSPVSYADTAVPTLIVQGDKDKVVPLQQSKKLSRKLKKANVQNSLIIVKDGMSAQTTRLNTVASNIANAETVSSSIDQTYRARHCSVGLPSVPRSNNLATVSSTSVAICSDCMK